MRQKAGKAVVLLSGGLDSAVTLYYALAEGYHCVCVSFDYGQRHRRELGHAKKIAASAGVPFHVVKISMPWKGSSLLDLELPLEKRGVKAGRAGIPATYVPGRNIIFLSFAVSLAEACQCPAVFIGAHSQDYSGYPDCRPEFYSAFALAVRKGTKTGVEGRPVRIITPLINKDKAEIIRLGRRLGVPFELTWSCYAGGAAPCGTCDSCRFRAKGFREAGAEDPALWDGSLRGARSATKQSRF